MVVPAAIATIVLAAIAAFTDWRRGVIPNWITLPPLVAAPLAYGGWYGTPGLAFSILGLIGCGLIPYLLFRIDAIGGGDVKLFAALGAVDGVLIGGEILVTAFGFACVVSVVMLAAQRRLGRVLGSSLRLLLNTFLPRSRRREVPPESLTEMRLGPAILAAALWIAVGG